MKRANDCKLPNKEQKRSHPHHLPLSPRLETSTNRQSPKLGTKTAIEWCQTLSLQAHLPIHTMPVAGWISLDSTYTKLQHGSSENYSTQRNLVLDKKLRSLQYSWLNLHLVGLILLAIPYPYTGGRLTRINLPFKLSLLEIAS